MLHAAIKTPLVFCVLQALRGLFAQDELEVEDFADVKESEYFVDKTLLIKEILNHKYLLITAPRRFGKSINFDMISLFLRNDHDRSKVGKTFKGTQILKEKRFVEEHMNCHPVLFCSFDAGLEVMCDDTLLGYYRNILYGIFIEHDYLKESPALTEEQRQVFNKYIDENNDLEAHQILNGLRLISQFLFIHHDKKVIVLIDEYDAIVMDNILNKDNSTLKANEDEFLNITRKIIDFHYDLLRNTFENDDYIENAFISGILPLNFQNDSPGSIKFQHVEFTQGKEISKYYGLTQKEFKALMKKFKVTTEKQNEVQKYFDGYSSPQGRERVYSPWVISKFLKLKFVFSFWVNSFPLKKFLLPLMMNSNIGEILVKLVKSKDEVTITLKEVFTLKDVENLRKTFDQRCDEKTDVETFLQFLLHVGYLTYKRPDKVLPKSVVAIKVPNKEIRQELSKMIKEHFAIMLES